MVDGCVIRYRRTMPVPPASSLLTVFLMRTDRTITSLELTRVPCIGEIIHLRRDPGANDEADRERESDWRVTYVQHLPPITWQEQCVAEIWAVEIPETEHPWDPATHPRR